MIADTSNFENFASWGFKRSDFDPRLLPDYAKNFSNQTSLAQFSAAFSESDSPTFPPDGIPLSIDDHHFRQTYQATQADTQRSSVFISSLNDSSPVQKSVLKRKSQRGKYEIREGFVFTILQYPLLAFVIIWLGFLSFTYLTIRMCIGMYELTFSWRGHRKRILNKMYKCNTYDQWKAAAKELDQYLGNDKWQSSARFSHYDCLTIRRVMKHLIEYRRTAEIEEQALESGDKINGWGVNELRTLLMTCVRNNFAGTDNPRMYSETYFGTKKLLQAYVDEVEKSLAFMLQTKQLTAATKRQFFRHLRTNFGQTALCLSGGATLAYYHFGVARALLEAGRLPKVISGTSGGAFVAALLCTRTDTELSKLLVPALADKITACHDDFKTWVVRWWETGAGFDAIDWADRCAWFCRGDTTFKEAYEQTGRILNVSCVPSNPYWPTILANYLTSPDCVIWSAVLASAAAPGILNPVVLMKKTVSENGSYLISPYSLGHKWKDGSLKTDIPIRSLNLHFNVNFSIVSQVNPHVSLFFFSSRGAVGQPVRHRNGRGWRGGFVGSAIEQYIKLNLKKWLRVVRQLELLPCTLACTFNDVWLQQFSGTVTIWPKTEVSDFLYILSDPTYAQLARMIRTGMQSTWPKLLFVDNRMKIESIIGHGCIIGKKDVPVRERVWNSGLKGHPSIGQRNSSCVITTTGTSKWDTNGCDIEGGGSTSTSTSDNDFGSHSTNHPSLSQ